MGSWNYAYEGMAYRRKNGRWYDLEGRSVPSSVRNGLEKKYEAFFGRKNAHLGALRERRWAYVRQRRDMLYRFILDKYGSLDRVLPADIKADIETCRELGDLRRLYRGQEFHQMVYDDMMSLANEHGIVLNAKALYIEKLKDAQSRQGRTARENLSTGREKLVEKMQDPEFRKRLSKPLSQRDFVYKGCVYHLHDGDWVDDKGCVVHATLANALNSHFMNRITFRLPASLIAKRELKNKKYMERRQRLLKCLIIPEFGRPEDPEGSLQNTTPGEVSRMLLAEKYKQLMLDDYAGYKTQRAFFNTVTRDMRALARGMELDCNFLEIRKKKIRENPETRDFYRNGIRRATERWRWRYKNDRHFRKTVKNNMAAIQRRRRQRLIEKLDALHRILMREMNGTNGMKKGQYLKLARTIPVKYPTEWRKYYGGVEIPLTTLYGDVRNLKKLLNGDV